MSTTGHTWRDPHTEKAAKLDMAILYNVSRNADQGEVQWTGAQEHDHARIAMTIGQELWGPPCRNQERDTPIQRKPKIRQKDLLPHVESLQADLAPATADILQRIASKTITAKEGKEFVSCISFLPSQQLTNSFRREEERTGEASVHRTTTPRRV